MFDRRRWRFTPLAKIRAAITISRHAEGHYRYNTRANTLILLVNDVAICYNSRVGRRYTTLVLFVNVMHIVRWLPYDCATLLLLPVAIIIRGGHERHAITLVVGALWRAEWR